MNRVIKQFMDKLFYTCEQATLLIEKKGSAKSISFWENIRLQGHLAVCKFCNAYNKKVKIIDRTMSRLSQEPLEDKEKVEEAEFKNQIKVKIIKKSS